MTTKRFSCRRKKKQQFNMKKKKVTVFLLNENINVKIFLNKLS